MSVDVTTTVDVNRPRDQVAAYVIDPANATRWYKNITSVDYAASEPLRVGSKVAFQARFLGRSLAYTYEISELVPGHRLVMRTADGPFPMETTYRFDDATGSATKVTLRNRGEPVGFSRFLTPLMAPAMRRANRQDLKRLKSVIESAAES